MKRILSGIQPTGNLHLGNYLGAIRNWVTMQNDYDCLFMLADLHAITVPQDPAALLAATREVAATYIACGIDPTRSVIFPQSAVPAHTELAWILNCHTPLGWLNRMAQFKAKKSIGDSKFLERVQKALMQYTVAVRNLPHSMTGAEFKKSAPVLQFQELFISLCEDYLSVEKTNLGLFSYPVLQAADILGYHATHVPVGEDQKQHIELARDIAGAFNRAYGTEFFTLPEPVIQKHAARVMSLKDGTKKMSKSDPSDLSRINLMDDADTIAKKFKKAKSDMEPGITYDVEKRPEASNLLQIFAGLTDRTVGAVQAEYADAQFSTFKQDLADAAVAHLAPIAERTRELMEDVAQLDAILRASAEKANAIAGETLKEVRKLVGFIDLA